MLRDTRIITTLGIIIVGLMVNSEKAYGECWCLQLIVDAPQRGPHGYRCNDFSHIPSPTLEACDTICKNGSGGNWKTYGACEDQQACKYYMSVINMKMTNQPPPRCTAINY